MEIGPSFDPEAIKTISFIYKALHVFIKKNLTEKRNTAGRLGFAAIQEIPLYWSGLTKELKCVEKLWVYHGEWSP